MKAHEQPRPDRVSGYQFQRRIGCGDASIGLPWRITGSNDFDQNGISDIFSHNESSGETQIWLMSGRRVKGRATVDAARGGGGVSVGPPWRIVAH